MPALSQSFVLLSQISDTELPAEFILFKRGLNETTNGVYLFDQVAAASVMSHYAREGVDLPIDLEHDSLDKEAAISRSDARDARGWFRLEMRGGDLWATSVQWTPDGARRLRERTQRYVSPAFQVEPAGEGAKRVLRILNVALVSAPATHNAPALASRLHAYTSRATVVISARARARAAALLKRL